MFRLILASCFLLLHFVADAQVHIIPQPASVKQVSPSRYFRINAATVIVTDGSNMDNAVNYLNDYLDRLYHLRLKTAGQAAGNNVIRLNFERMDQPAPGAYTLNVDSKGVYIAGDNEQGVFYGIQTLIQLLPPPANTTAKKVTEPAVPHIEIKDAPRFGYRGMMLDASRNFMSVDFVKKFIDYLALHKLNYFHWHLTDDQGWRIEIKKYPRLTDVGAWRNGTIIGRYPGTGNTNTRHGGFYTQEEVKEVVKYAAERYITVVPEIEMPGHGSAAIAAYPELSCFPGESTFSYFPKDCTWSGDTTGKQVQQTWGVFADVFCPGKENTFKFLQDVIDEVAPLFPGQFIHVGGDECPKSNWKKCPQCQQRIKENDLKDEHGLQSYLIRRMEKYINGKGKKLLGWDEILEGGLAPNATVMSWRGEAGGIEAAKQNHDVVMTPTTYVYFDYSQTLDEDSVTIGGFVNLEKVYNYEPVPAVLTTAEGKHVLGAQANLWSEYLTNPSKVEYMIFPRMAALSEVTWSKKNRKNWGDFQKRLHTQFKRYELWGASYSKAYFDLESKTSAADDNKAVLWSVRSADPNADIRYTISAAGQTSNGNYKKPLRITAPSVVTAWAMNGEKTVGKKISSEFHFNRATGAKITLANPPAENYPGDGPFTLVNGIQNVKGLTRSREFLGFEGTDCEATIDLGKDVAVNRFVVHTLEQQGTWIYYPSSVEIFISKDGKNFSRLTHVTQNNGSDKTKWDIQLQTPSTTRYVRFAIKNNGIIADNLPGAGHKAWLFIDEIEVH